MAMHRLFITDDDDDDDEDDGVGEDASDDVADADECPLSSRLSLSLPRMKSVPLRFMAVARLDPDPVPVTLPLTLLSLSLLWQWLPAVL